VYLVVDVFTVQGDVDGEGGGVVVRPQRRLLVGTVAHHEVHDGLGLHRGEEVTGSEVNPRLR